MTGGSSRRSRDRSVILSIVRQTTIAALLCALAACGPRVDAPGALSAEGRARAAPADRLGDDVIPVAAELALDIDPESAAYRGRVVFELDVRRPVRSIWLHARDLAVVAELGAGRDRIAPIRVEIDRERGLLGLQFSRAVPDGARLALAFEGKLGDRAGLFRQKQAGRHYVFSDLEPIDARSAFPCFDDPRFKLPWTVTITAPKGQRAFANSPSAGERTMAGGSTEFSFAATPPLPSYLVAIAVGPFEVVEGPREPVPLRVIAPKGQARRARWALDAAASMLRQLEAYFEMKTPFAKLDLVVIPEFNGAMENPGLFTFASHILLVEGREDSDAQSQSAGIVGHELAHLWFGDLVTMSWWSDLWLNEAFATWMSEKLVVTWDPGMDGRLLDAFDRASALREDRWPQVAAVRRGVANEREVLRRFDVLTYRKGGALVEMFEGFVGEQAFQRALRRYVRDHAFGSVDARDLYAAVASETKTEVTRSFDRFVSEPGVPLIDVVPVCDDRGARVGLRQSRYRLLSGGRAGSGRDRAWPIPICVAYPEKGQIRRECTLLAAESGELRLSGRTCPRWIHPNPGERGYYYFRMPSDAMRALAERSDLTEVEATGLVDHVDALLHAGAMDVATALDVLAPLAARTDQTPLAVLDLLRALAIALPASARPAIAEAAERMFGGAIDDELAGKQPASGLARLSRIRIAERAARLVQSPELRKRALRQLQPWFQSGGTLPVIALNLAAPSGDAELYTQIEGELDTKPKRGAAAEAAILGALVSFGDAALTERALSQLSRVPWWQGYMLLSRALELPDAHAIVISYLRDHASELSDQLAAQLPELAEALCDPDHGAAIAELVRKREAVDDTALERTLARIAQCTALRDHLAATLTSSPARPVGTP